MQVHFEVQGNLVFLSFRIPPIRIQHGEKMVTNISYRENWSLCAGRFFLLRILKSVPSKGSIFFPLNFGPKILLSSYCCTFSSESHVATAGPTFRYLEDKVDSASRDAEDTQTEPLSVH